MKDLQSLKARVDLRSLIQETHPVTKSSKTQCLWHDDRNPSLHIYPDGYFCFACGASGDHLDWLTATRALSFQEAVDVLAAHAGSPGHFISIQRKSTTLLSRDDSFEKPNFEWRLPLKQHVLETHKRRAVNLTEIPEALTGRGFTLTDCKQLDIVNENGNAIFPVTGPSWVLTLKCRYAFPNPHRYEYITPGRGTPAWCSPDICQAKTILVTEGELNGMMCWLVLRAQENQIGVMGTAGTNGLLHLDILENKVVYIYTDDDEAGHEAKQRWAKQILGAGAKEVYLLKPWSADACDIAGAFGKAALRKRLTWSEKQRYSPAECFDAPKLTGALNPATNLCPSSPGKSDLMQWCSQLRVTPTLGSALPLLSLAAMPLENRHDAA